MFSVVATALLIAVAGPAQSPPVDEHRDVPLTSTREHLDAMRHLRLGEDTMRVEQWDSAAAEFQEAIRLEPSLEMAHYRLGQVYMETRRYPNAVRAFVGCRDAFLSSNRQRALGDLRAQRALDEQIRDIEDQATALGSGRGSILSGSKFTLDRQIADLRALQRQSTSVGAIPAWISFALGSAYFRSGAMADAEREYRETIKADPRIGEAHNNLAVVCLQTGRFPEADVEIKAAEKAGFRVNPQLKEDVKKALARR